MHYLKLDHKKVLLKIDLYFTDNNIFYTLPKIINVLKITITIPIKKETSLSQKYDTLCDVNRMLRE